LPCGRRADTALSGTKASSIATSCEPVPRMPRTCQVSHTDALGFERQRKMQYRLACFRVVADGAGDQKIARRNAACKNLACVGTPAPVNAFGSTGTFEPIRSTGADKHQLLIGDAGRTRWAGLVASARPFPRRGVCALPALAPSNYSAVPECATFRKFLDTWRHHLRVPWECPRQTPLVISARRNFRRRTCRLRHAPPHGPQSADRVC
jgi:hypothetical protein